MADRPIIFSSADVRATLDGRKTMFRRVIAFPRRGAFVLVEMQDGSLWPYQSDDGESALCSDGDEHPMVCPFGAPGDTLWVRETWGVGTRPCEREGWRDGIEYRADDHDLDKRDLLPLHSKCVPSDVALDEIRRGWRSPIHMPRWASRLTLRVTDVRVERLQEISEDDAQAEGVEPLAITTTWQGQACGGGGLSAKEMFSAHWDSINGKRAPWSSNPWVWVVSFERVKEGVRG